MRFLCLGLIIATSLAGQTAVVGQLPQAKLTGIFPPGAPSGTTNEITVSGTDLDEPSDLIFSDSRLTATATPGATGKFQIVVPAEVTEGIVDVRFVGRFGVSNPRAFAVGRRPEFIAPSTNTSPASAIELSLETTANGRVNPNANAWFRFVATGGQRLIIRVVARELDSRLVPDLTVTDSTGRELAVARRREWLDFTVPTDGSYLLKLNDEIFGGGDDYHFQLTLVTGPQLDFALPNVLRAGATNDVTLFGRNLPGGKPSPLTGSDGVALEQLDFQVTAPSSASTLADTVALLAKSASASLTDDLFVWRLSSTNGSSNPLLFALTKNAVATTVTSNELPSVIPPCEFSGLFAGRGQLSGVRFDAHKGDVFWLELFADRLGYPSDPSAVIQHEQTGKGENGETLYVDVTELTDSDTNLGDREFNTATRDASVRFEAPETGTYRVVVRDRFNLGKTRPRFPYRLSLHREVPDFRLVALPLPPPRAGEDRKIQVLSVTLRREETIALKVLAFRRDGFNGDIELTATNLPTGVSAATTRIAAGKNVGTLLLTASADATGMIEAVIQGTATVGSDIVTHSSPLASVVWQVPDFNNESVTSRLARDTIFSVVSAEQAPISVAVTETKPIEVAVDGKLSLTLLIERRGEFPAAFNLKPAGHAAFDKAKDVAVAEKATNVTAEINLAETKLPVGTHTLWFQGSVTGKYRNNPEALTLAETELKTATEALASVSEADKPEAEERQKAAEAAKKAAEEKAKPQDVTVQVFSRPFVVNVLPAAKPEEEKK